ncbi:MAG: transposase [Nitrosomonas sp.]|nr:transposase [Nitrosomonas sp.]
MKSTSGSFQLDTPRDRNGTFEPQLVKKHQTHFTDVMERKILSLFAESARDCRRLYFLRG